MFGMLMIVVSLFIANSIGNSLITREKHKDRILKEKQEEAKKQFELYETKYKLKNKIERKKKSTEELSTELYNKQLERLEQQEICPPDINLNHC